MLRDCCRGGRRRVTLDTVSGDRIQLENDTMRTALSFGKQWLPAAALVLLSGCPELNATAVAVGDESPPANDVVNDIITGAATSESCSLDSLTTEAVATQILSGKDVLDSSGRRIAGTMADLGTVDLTQAFSGPGYVAGFTGLAASSICSSTQLFGVTGSANCAASFPALSVSGTLSWGAITAPTTKTLTLSIPSTGSNFAKLSFSGTGTSGFRITSVAGRSVSTTPSSGTDIVAGLTYSNQNSVTVDFIPVYIDGSSKTMAVSVSDANGVSTTVNADATFTNPIPGVSGLIGWYAASALDLADGASVSAWNDASTASPNHATQTTVAARPTYSATEMGGQPAISFSNTDGTEDSLNFTSRFTTIQTAIIVYKHRTGSQDYPFLIGDASTISFHGGGTGDLFYSSSVPFTQASYVNGTSTPLASMTKGTTPKILTLIGPSANVAAMYISKGNYDGRFWNGWIAEIVFFNTAIGSTDLNAVECSLAGKYGISLGHGC